MFQSRILTLNQKHEAIKKCKVEKVALSILKVILLKSNTLRFLAHLAKGQVSFCHHLASSVRPPHVVNFHILIFSSETTGPIATNLWWNGPWEYMSKRPLPKRPHFYQSAPTFYQDATVFLTKTPPLFIRISYFTKTLPLFYCQNGTFNNFFLLKRRYMYHV